MKKLVILFSIVFVLFGVFLSKTNKKSFASEDVCKSTTYEIDADEDNTDHLSFADTANKVDIVFNDINGFVPAHNHRNQVIVTAGSGYEIVNVQYELEHYSGIGWTTVLGVNPTTTITLAGVDDDSWIDEVEVKLQSICPTPTPILDCDGDTDGSHPNKDDQECVTPTVTVTPIPTNTPSNGGGSNDGGDGLGCATHDCSGNQVGGGSSSSQPIQAVLGASTMAGTGTFENTVMNFMLAAGIVVLALGAKKYAKESK